MGVDLTGIINFYSHTIDGSPPWMDTTPKLGWLTTNYVQIPTRIPIYDIRGRENDFHLDKNAFEFHQYLGNLHNLFDDHSEEQQFYYEEIQNILKTRLGASRVIIYNHVMRSRGPPRPPDQCDPTHRNPIYYPHVDNDPTSARMKMKAVLGEEEAQKLINKRFQIINVWRPLGPNPIVNNPLTICDYQSIDLKNDLHLSEVQASENTTCSYALSRNVNDAQKWYYVSNMRSNEMLVFKIFDSNENFAQFGGHTAFINENEPLTNIEQCSIEMRCLVLYDE